MLIVESLKKASIDSNREIRDNALKTLSNIKDQSKNFIKINQIFSNFKEDFCSIHKSFDQGLVISKLQCGY
jgi:vesicle coat complex subunit